MDNYMKSLVRISSILSGVTVSLCYFTATAGEYWISASNSLSYLSTDCAPGAQVCGQGTFENPFYGNFDQIITSIGTDSIIHLWPGVYWSSGDIAQTPNFGLKWKTGQKLRGSGIDTTVLRITNQPGTDWFLAIIWATNADSVEISDLTAEYSTAPTIEGVRNGLELFGSQSKIDRVKVTGLYGTNTGNWQTSRECFGLKVGNNSSHKGGRIADCEVSGPFYGNYHSATAVSGEVVVRNNRVIFEKVASQIGPNDKFQGFNFGDANHVTFEGNYQYGGSSGVFSDWATCTNVVAVGNHFRLTLFPITLKPDGDSKQWRDVYFARNIIEADCDNFWGSYISPSGGASITNIVVAENVTIPYSRSSTTNPVSALNISIGSGGSMAGVRTFRNIWPTNSSYTFNFSAPFTISDNLDLEGVSSHMNPQTFPRHNELEATAALPTVICAIGANYQLERDNQSVVIVTGTSGTSTVYLPVIKCPNPTWLTWPGRQVTIINASTSGTVTVNTSNISLEQIRKTDGSSATSLPINANSAPVKFVSGDNGIWYQL